MRQAVDVRLNRMVFDYDQIIICGPTFPARGCGVFRGQQILLPGDRWRHRDQLFALAGRCHHELFRDWDQADTSAPRHRPGSIND